jgi:hypothetical protein
MRHTGSLSHAEPSAQILRALKQPPLLGVMAISAGSHTAESTYPFYPLLTLRFPLKCVLLLLSLPFFVPRAASRYLNATLMARCLRRLRQQAKLALETSNLYSIYSTSLDQIPIGRRWSVPPVRLRDDYMLIPAQRRGLASGPLWPCIARWLLTMRSVLVLAGAQPQIIPEIPMFEACPDPSCL